MIFPLLLLVGFFSQAPQIEWVIRDVVPPREINSSYVFTLGPTWPFGPSSQEGLTSWVLSNSFAGSLSAHLDLNFFSGVGDPVATRIFPNDDYFTAAGTWATLATPHGAQILLGQQTQVGLVSFDASTGQKIGVTVMPTNLPGGAPDPQRMWNLHAAGDINGDGWEDCFWTDTSQNLWVYCGLLDGATLTVPWVTTFRWTNSNVIVPAFWEPQILPDITGDGHADFFVGRNKSISISAGDKHSWMLLSGVDGTVIWSQIGDDFNSVQFPYGRDLSGDGKPDAVVRVGDFLRGLSVIDGVELWQSPLAPLWNSAGQNEFISHAAGVGGFLFSHDLAATGHDSVVYPVLLTVRTGTASDQRTGFGHFDAVDGSFQGVFYTPQSLKPWSTDIYYSSDMIFPIGDHDRDGLAEWYARNPDPANTPPLFANMGRFNERMVILGQRTLFVPETYVMGAAFNLDIAIPSAPNKDYLVLFSTAFDAAGGITMEKWETKLGVSPVLTYTYQQRLCAGTLDADGQASTFISVPPYPPLYGSTLYSRAIILNPTGSAERIWTISSLGVTEIQ